MPVVTVLCIGAVIAPILVVLVIRHLLILRDSQIYP